MPGEATSARSTQVPRETAANAEVWAQRII